VQSELEVAINLLSVQQFSDFHDPWFSRLSWPISPTQLSALNTYNYNSFQTQVMANCSWPGHYGPMNRCHQKAETEKMKTVLGKCWVETKEGLGWHPVIWKALFRQ